jgi:Fic family protein
MMGQLIDFIQNSSLHPVLKACIAHFYFVYVHPFGDGNGRTARALSYMMLLRSGYDFFRYFSISDIVAKERGKYYHAIKNTEDSDGDMTYFIDFYSDMLARTVQKTEDHLIRHVYTGQKIRELTSSGKLNERQLKGAKWILESQQTQITVEACRKKLKISVETARQDLLLLCDQGLLVRTMQGKKAVFKRSPGP